MATVRILNNSMNPLGWRVGNEVEITINQGLFDLRDRKLIEVIDYSEEEIRASRELARMEREDQLLEEAASTATPVTKKGVKKNGSQT